MFILFFIFPYITFFPLGQPLLAFFEWNEELQQPHLTNRKFRSYHLEDSKDSEDFEDSSQLSEKPLTLNFECEGVEKPLDLSQMDSFKQPLCRDTPIPKLVSCSICQPLKTRTFQNNSYMGIIKKLLPIPKERLRRDVRGH